MFRLSGRRLLDLYLDRLPRVAETIGGATGGFLVGYSHAKTGSPVRGLTSLNVPLFLGAVGTVIIFWPVAIPLGGVLVAADAIQGLREKD